MPPPESSPPTPPPLPPPPSDQDPVITDALRRDIESLYAPPATLGMTQDRDAAILGEARARAGAIRDAQRSSAASRRRVLRIGMWGGALAAAAGLALAVIIWGPTRPAPVTPGPTAHGPQALLKDINGDGVVDILDALALALTLDGRARADAVDAAWDFTGDGVVDRRDVDAIAAAAVRLHDGERG